jgi:methoxymalonate biosynthesis acyl carrier protein
MSRRAIISPVREFLQRYVGDKDIEENEEIFATGLVNSLFAMQLVLFLENSFNLEISGEDLVIQNFKSLNTIADFVLIKRNK